MSRLSLYLLLYRIQHLGSRRNPAFEQSVVAKVLAVFGSLFFVAYLIMFGIAIGSAAVDEGCGVMFFAMFFFVIGDFFLRFVVQKTPDMLIKPFLLLPIPRNAVIEFFLVSATLSVYNLLWVSMMIPFMVIAIAGGASFGVSLLVVLTSLLLLLANSHFYLIMRTLIKSSQWWWLLAIAILSLPVLPISLFPFRTVFDAIITFGESPLSLLAVVALLVVLAAIDRRLQLGFTLQEVASESKESVRTTRFSLLDRFGNTGEYLKLEIRSLMRNKVVRTRFWSSIVLTTLFSLMIAYTPVYDGNLSRNFFCFYCFALFGVTTLVKVMCPEGNYIDVLMTHRENILQLLHAKYYFQCIFLILPFLLMLPAVFAGKFTMLMMLAYLFQTSGTVFMLLFHLAIFNNQTMPLMTRITGKGNIENGFQLIIELVAMIIPIVLVSILLLVFEQTTAYSILIIIGILLTGLHPWWLRMVYKRMMIRRYELIDGFRQTR